MPLATSVPLVLLAFISLYGISLSYKTITRLRAYEQQSEKAAEWSTTAAERLHKTRTTQAGAAITLSLSALASLSLLTPLLAAPRSALPLAVLNTALLTASRVHMQRFWNKRVQTQIPFVEKFNRAVKGSEELVTVLQLLALGWAAAGVLGWVAGNWRVAVLG
ncbi:hypothetical protein K505DRAFT_330658 [Melanomma pulvis-pyrius CBS 109.77]|uniref:DUF1772-domain-containing protein n=1 Tax=Melanomma pulvis-pyrius CBS 109.77 TaxID=1314802 RepID=A0A6A6WPZ3_9PLEO|nr:hypothetical protein K505DRAFT_330658 [Melanomma pulvis-pyrius CBS 109.77]